jgi:RimJ/RimL family protein N-acetyltransferase
MATTQIMGNEYHIPHAAYDYITLGTAPGIVLWLYLPYSSAMIAKSTIEALGPERQLLLAPFTAQHIRPYLPVPLQLLDHQPTHSLEYFTARKPRDFFRIEARLSYTRTWGIFLPELAGYRQEPEAFIGAVALSDRVDEQGVYTPNIQELSISIFRPEWIGKGIGTMTQLAVCQHALDTGISAVVAETAVHNQAEQRALTKAGFAYVRQATKPSSLINGTVGYMQQWWLLSEEALAANESRPNYEQLAAGRQTFLDATARLAIRTI